MITVIPSGGLCDRLMTIESAISFAKQVNDAGITIVWKLNDELNASFEDLLQPIQNLRVRNVADSPSKKRTLLRRIINRTKKIWKKYIIFDEPVYLQDLFGRDQSVKNTEICTRYHKQKEKITIEGFGQFCLEDASFYCLFKLSASLENDLQSIVRLFPERIIGVHLRRTDNIFAIRESPTSLFIDKMKGEIENDPGVSFYVATDSLEELNNLIAIFGDRIYFQKDCIRNRTTIPGMECAVLDLYALGVTNNIWGSYWSVYSYTAARIGGKDFLSLYKQDNHTKEEK